MILALVLVIAAQEATPPLPVAEPQPPPTTTAAAPTTPSTTTPSTTTTPAEPSAATEAPLPSTETPPPTPTGTETTQSPNPPPPAFPQLSPAERGVIVPTPGATTPMATSPTTTAASDDFWSSGHAGHYLAWYGAEYAAIGIAGGLYASGIHNRIAPAPASIGPRFDLERPDLQLLFDPRLDDVIGRPLLKEKVPTSALGIGAAAVLLGVTGVDWLATGDLHRTHNLVLGGAETLVGTLIVTETLKLTMGRLRPDFRERWVRAACAGNVEKPAALDCSGVADGFEVSEEDVFDGMKSFVSGHSSTSFAVATFGSLWLGSTLVWSDDRPAWGPAVGALGIGALYASAAGVAATRLSDNRHHPEDVAVGAALGTAVAATIFFVHFDIDGAARHRSWTVVPTAGLGTTGDGTGLALAGAF